MSVFSDLKPKNKASRNGFDLSRRVVFSNKSGQIVPMFVQPTLPDSEYRIDISQLMRTQPLQTAAFTGAGINYDFVFVPLNHLYSSFNQFVAQRENRNLVNQPSNLAIPTFNLRAFVKQVLLLALYDYANATFWSTSDNYYKSALSLQTQPAFDDIPPFMIGSNNVDNSQSVYLGCIRTLDMLGYGNYLPCLEVLLQAFIKRYFPSAGSQYRVAYLSNNVANYNKSASSYDLRFATILADFESTLSDVFDEILPAATIMPNLWPVLAYNKCFYEYYRNTYYDLVYNVDSYYAAAGGLDNFAYVYLFNFDDWTSTFTNSNLQPYELARLIAMFAPKYHTYKRDLFTGVLPSTQFGSVEVMTDDRSWLQLINMDASGIQGKAYSTNPSGGSSPVRVNSSVASSTAANDKWRFDPALAISVLESRRADAMQRFKERMMRAGDKTKDIFKAHGWSKPLSEGSFEPIFLGSFDGRLELNPVAATTDTQASNGTELAQLGSHGTAVVSGSRISIKTKDFGIIIGLNYILKDAEYDAYGLDRHLQLTEPFDYPYPELQNISLAPIVRGELCSIATDNSGASERDFNKVLGYLPRFMEFKSSVDKVHGEFFSSNPLIQSLDSYQASTWPQSIRKGTFSDWTTPRTILDFLSVAFMYQSTNVFDNVFYQASNSLQSTDQFLFNCYVRCQSVEPISVIGLPI